MKRFWLYLESLLIFSLSALFFFSIGMLLVSSSRSRFIPIADLFKLSGSFSYGFILIFLLALLLMSIKVVVLAKNNKATKGILKQDLLQLNFREIGTITNELKPSDLKLLLENLIQSSQTYRNPAILEDELSQFLTLQAKQFDSFKTWINLFIKLTLIWGLLGTFWGAFISMFSGSLDYQELTSGLGISLAPLIIGLITAMLIYLLSTFIHQKFEQRLLWLTTIGNGFRLKLYQPDFL